MKLSSWAFAALLVCARRVAANVRWLQNKEDDKQICSGMYNMKSWGGSLEPSISVDFEKQAAEGNDDPIVSIIIFEWNDEEYVGRYPMVDAVVKEYICDDENIKAQLCNDTQIGEFIVHPDANRTGKSSIVTQAVHIKDPPEIKYPIERTGYYCVGSFGYGTDTYRAKVEFRNSYGQLPAAQIAKLPFYGGLTIVYAVIGVFWAFLYVQNRHDILAVQNYITAIIVFLIVEMLMTWGFYDYQNRHGSNVGTKVLMIIVAILNAGRNSFSFFLLLIVCLGYGVVKPSLGKTMLMVRGLALGHFVFGVIYAVASLSITPESAGPLVLLVILPLSGTLTAFYVWTLNALNLTIKDLVERKQTVKAMMYKKLWWCILGSILVIFGFFFINSFSFAGSKDPDFVPDHWQTRWFLLDGWLNLVYLVDLAFISYIWRPTRNNRRFAMSDEIAQDDEGFEVASFGGSLDEEEGAEGTAGAARPGDRNPRAPSNVDGQDGDNQSSMPQPHPTKAKATPVASDLPRESLDGEPVFAVGDEDNDADRWSEAEDDDEDAASHVSGGEAERKRLTAKSE